MRTLGIAVASVVVFALLGVVGTFVWRHRSTTYTATAIMEVRFETNTTGDLRRRIRRAVPSPFREQL